MRKLNCKTPEFDQTMNQAGETMLVPEEVSAILGLKRQGWGTRKIGKELGISRNTVRTYLRKGNWEPYGKPKRSNLLEGLEPWLEDTLLQHRGNAAVVRQELSKKLGIKASLRTVQRATQEMRQRLKAATKATVRFETPPGKQMQIDFGTRRIEIGGELKRISLFVATLGYSRRIFVKPFDHERQSAWFEGMEGAFQWFNGIPAQILLDNATALVQHHNVETREVKYNDKLLAFAKHWNFIPKACAPYRPRTKGKDERGVSYVKHNAIAGHQFDTWQALEAHLDWWMREVSDSRIHGTTAERPIDRFQSFEADQLKPLDDKPPFQQTRELIRKVNQEACIEVDCNSYSVPWALIGSVLLAQVAGFQLVVFKGSDEVARHPISTGYRDRVIDYRHLAGIVGAAAIHLPTEVESDLDTEGPKAELSLLLRPLADYEAIAGGSW